MSNSNSHNKVFLNFSKNAKNLEEKMLRILREGKNELDVWK